MAPSKYLNTLEWYVSVETGETYCSFRINDLSSEMGLIGPYNASAEARVKQSVNQAYKSNRFPTASISFRNAANLLKARAFISSSPRPGDIDVLIP